MAGINFRTTSAFAAVTGNSASTGGSPTNATTLFTCPSSHETEVVFLRVSNNQGSAETVGIQIFTSDDSTYNDLVKVESISANSSKQFIDAGPIFLHEGDKVLIYRNDSSKNFSATLSARLYFTPAKRKD